MSLNVLLITFSFPPAGGVGVLRALSLARYLPENDIRVDVLTARNAPSVGRDLSLLAQIPAAVTVHRCWTLDLPFALRKAIKRLISGRQAPRVQPPGAPAANGQRSPAAGNPLKRLLGNLLLPDPQVGWLPFALPAARRIIRKRKIDVVLITVPPFSSVLLVSRLRKAFPSLPVVLDFRDEWLTTTLDFVSFNKNERARSVAYKAEAEAVRDASAVVLVTEAAQLELQTRYPAEDPAKFLYLPNGFETRQTTGGAARAPSTPSSEQAATVPLHPSPARKVVLTYLGSVYGSTDPSTFIEAVLGLPAALRERLLVRFIGHIETDHLRSALLQLGANVELKGFIPQAQALKAIDDTDFLLLITHDRINVSAKFYDYLSGGKPIVAAVHPAGDVRKLLEQTRAGRWADIADPVALRALLADLLTAGAGTQTESPDLQRIAGFHRQALAGRYAELLRQIATPHEHAPSDGGRAPGHPASGGREV